MTEKGNHKMNKKQKKNHAWVSVNKDGSRGSIYYCERQSLKKFITLEEYEQMAFIRKINTQSDTEYQADITKEDL